jgi:succinoglycan biosynthesis protein ExoA
VSQEGLGASILVPVFNEEAHVARSVGAMLGQRFDRGFEVLVIDGASEDRTAEIIARMARDDERVRMLANPARRTPQALNIGLQHARGEYIVRMDAHAYYPPDYVARAVARFERGGVDCVSGPQIPYGEGRWSTRIALALGTWLGMGGATFRNATRETETDTAFTGVWLRDRLMELHGWDEGWPVNQDAELAARIREAGGRIVSIPELAARYVPRDSLRQLARQYWRYGKYRAKTARRHARSLRRSHLLAPGVVLTAATAPLPGPVGQLARRGLGAYAAALVVASLRPGASGPVSLVDRAALPLVFVTMHLSWGAGFIVGAARFGPPMRAVVAAAGVGRFGSAR